jgi:hypothetical protein
MLSSIPEETGFSLWVVVKKHPIVGSEEKAECEV